VSLRRYLGNVGAAASRLLNALKGGAPGETTSSAEGRYNRTQPKTSAPTLTKILDAIDPGHTEKAIEYGAYGAKDPHGLKDHPPGAAKYLAHAFDPDPEDPTHCQALVRGLKCKAPVYHECHDIPGAFVG
jgi:hypothetical protein